MAPAEDGLCSRLMSEHLVIRPLRACAGESLLEREEQGLILASWARVCDSHSKGLGDQ